MASRVAPLEAAVQATILDVARLHRWLAYHTFDSQQSAGGFSDLVLVRERVIFAEVKRAGQRPRADQSMWLGELARTGAEVYLWTLDDIDEIARILACRGGIDFVPASAWIPGRGRSDAA